MRNLIRIHTISNDINTIKKGIVALYIFVYMYICIYTYTYICIYNAPVSSLRILLLLTLSCLFLIVPTPPIQPETDNGNLIKIFELVKLFFALFQFQLIRRYHHVTLEFYRLPFWRTTFRFSYVFPF